MLERVKEEHKKIRAKESNQSSIAKIRSATDIGYDVFDILEILPRPNKVRILSLAELVARQQKK